MLETLTVQDSVELAVVERSGFIESRHAGAAVVLSPEGEVVARHGNADALILPRSSLKPLQAVACLTAGAVLEGEQLALSTASHSGTDRHAEVVREMLTAGGLNEDDLACPPAWPSDSATRDEMVREHGQEARIRMNCSGKHAAMLRACVATGWPTDGYLDPSHPLQAHIRDVIARLTGEKMAHTAIDGCGAPVYALSLTGLARAIHRIGTASERSPFALHRVAGSLVKAVRENPWTIDGPGRPDTIAIERLGVFAKGGAEGVMVMVAPNGTTVALKMLDGGARASTIVAATLLARAGGLSDADVTGLADSLPLTVLGGGANVGAIRPGAGI
ncbi:MULTISPECIES: asparaginase [Microbacterium]|uniref:asparaginase n=1 Tax=Microbacterium TaxID=33882 RepID=UPI0021A94393|nr:MULTISPECIES: asparaginase [Microbacterium]MCT1364841.1 asparaginase [Microbacterium sp. p3-SID131]MCT1377550.1 asparaginase [Microbacterium sp. p3-SID337]MCZ0708947.1 asparaginase [Microbacterium paraoxydans]MDH5134231.1 asparaginase [Microbacterium sp. RD10]MDH5138218.1 asparaginase [Microbacterium sp. RD11]